MKTLDKLAIELNEKTDHTLVAANSISTQSFITAGDLIIERYTPDLLSVMIVDNFDEVMIGYFSEDELPTLIKARERHFVERSKK